MSIEAEQIYRHFKGNLYKVVTVAEHTETGEQLVIYQALYGDYKMYARPLSMFQEEVDRAKYPEAIQKYRFELQETGEEESYSLDPLVEEYLDTDSYREKLNILHGLHHRITENMLLTMAVVVDFELPEGDIETKYDALRDCLLTKEKYECSRMG